MSEQLLPCPFCGGTAFMSAAKTAHCNHRICCHECQATLHNSSRLALIDEWNSRKYPWISISDRLPEESQTVLVCWKAGGFQVNELAWIEYEEADDGSLIGEPRWFDKDSFGSPWQSSPKFWMPIPKCPEVKP